MEEMINEFKIIETEDGFRVEIKGNKEAIRRTLSGFGFCDAFKGRAPFGPGFWNGFGNWCGSWQRTEDKKPSV